jgi:hypothetical protein
MMKPVSFGPFQRGVDASTGVLSQPKGSIPRASNMLYSKRGALKVCDGTAIVNAYNGAPTNGRGKAMCEFFFEPTGVAPYYLRIMKALDQPLGAPANLAAAIAAGGTLTIGQTYYYLVTALDNVGGETTASNHANATPTSGNQTITLTWNVVPNAVGYNVYRSTSSGGPFNLLIGSGLPALSATYSDTGAAVTSLSLAVNSISSTTVPGEFFINLVNPYTGGLNVGTYTAGSNTAFNGGYQIIANASNNILQLQSSVTAVGTSTGGTFVISQSPPISDTTQQTALYAMPPAANGISYTDANIVALFPADARPVDTFPGGGGGFGGGGGGGGQQGSTASGGMEGNVNLIPQMVQFTNQAVLALGNGFPPQVYSDPNGTTTNPATSVAISAISVDANGVVTVTTAMGHNINLTQGIGANVIIAGVSNSAYNTNGHGVNAFVTIALPSGTQVKIVNPNAIGQAASSGGTLTVSTIPVISTFVPAYPQWTASVNYSINSIIVPTVSNGHYYKAVQGGTDGASQPTFPTGKGQQVSDGQIIWQEAGLLNSAAPPPPGCAHIVVYAGSVWMFNTSAANTATGLDGPCSLRMSDVNNLNSWNPINQAFLDKDDGTEGQGLAAFTITAQGIPPQGSLVAFKTYATYQIVGVFGSATFAIQRAETDMGCICPRTIQFIPGFGIGRMAHLGIAIFDGVNDRIVSPQIQPYLFASNDPDTSDIIPMDSLWMVVSQSAQTAVPPMYVVAIPVMSGGGLNGALQRFLCFDLVLKAWGIIDLPFPVSTMLQVRTPVSPVVTLMGSFGDGTLQRWQAGDSQWATASQGSGSSAAIVWSCRTPTVASKDPDQRLYVRRVVIRGQNDGSTISVTPRIGGESLATQPIVPVPSTNQGSLDYSVQAAVGAIGDRFDAVISGQGSLTIDSFGMHLTERPVGILAGAIS